MAEGSSVGCDLEDESGKNALLKWKFDLILCTLK